ncbi:inositol monophosphatase family protein [Beijerinckia indica]|uniref:Inositol monophosphatase n=1 Tax=Beijerinckia indica subsp. indica (strain ATCC 9039 / DSM 1715 / NCIMB 8712) TaxID=395963 RepID=B2II89_BEII9|nr:inositol monophosphatase family protein [Beijerinckia indica]ACB96043.1 inositol monophosphatase [Beijerinckia indica subsp. indica ATCC 9039]
MAIRIIEDVTDILREAAAEAILPRFRRLSEKDIEEKAPGDLVTAADRHAETYITERLRKLDPQARIVGEEACAAAPSLATGLDQGTIFVLDPLDGTGNFAAGRMPFAIMAALLREGEIIAAWILDPLSNQLCTAEQGSGAFIDGRRLKATPREAGPLRGSISTRFMPPDMREALEPRLTALLPDRLEPFLCAGAEYPALAKGERDFATFWRSLPWDHLPGTLFLREAGGHVARFDGTPYRAGQDGKGLIAAHSFELWQEARGLLIPNF